MQRLKDCNVVVKAMEDIDRECLVIPVLYRRNFSFLIPRASSKTARWNLEVTGSVQWTETGARPHDRDRDVRVLIHLQPERKLPAGTRLKDLDYDLSMDCHPFWHIRRSSCVTECNCEIVEVAITSIIFSEMREVATEGNALVGNLQVVVPCIRNTEKITAGQELVLRWEKKDGKKRGGGVPAQGA